MSHTFDIRFARSAGLAALLEAPSNRLRWKGGGRLSIDEEGVNIAVRRGTLSLFPHSRRIAAADLTEVYREGEALRLEYNTAGARREVMPFWVRDRDTAAQIVKLMPTRHTVELDEAPARPRFRVDLRVLSLLGVLVLGALGTALLMRDRAPADVAPAIEVADNVARVPVVEPVLVPVPVVVPVQGALAPTRGNSRSRGSSTTGAALEELGSPAEGAGSDAYAAAATSAVKTQVDDRDQRVVRPVVNSGVPIFWDRANALERLYFTLQPGIDVTRLRQLENGWWEIEVAIYNSREFDAGGVRNVLWAELSAARAWRHFLQAYRERVGRTGAGPPNEFDLMQLEFARRLTARVNGYQN